MPNHTHLQSESTTAEHDDDVAHHESKKVGPLEISTSTRYFILAGIWTATFISSINGTLVPTMIPSISSEFEASHQASWLGTAYLLATSTFTPLYGRLSNVLGRRGANQLAILFAFVGTLACGLSTNMNMLIAARFLAGIGGGGLLVTSNIIISDMYDLRSRGLTQGVASVFNGLGMGLGGTLGGLITDWLSWRWAFLLQLPILVIAFALTSWNLRYVTPGKGKSTKEVLKRIDYGGILSLLVAIGSCLVFLSVRYNESRPWSDVRVYTTATLSFVFAIVFILVEIFLAKEPVLAPFLLRQKIPVLVGCSNFLVALCNFSVIYFFPVYFQSVMLTSASVAGAHLFPNSVAMSLGSLGAGWLIHYYGRFKLLTTIFGLFPFFALVLILQMSETSGPIQLWLSIIPLGFGNAIVLQTMIVALLAHLPESHMAVGTGFGQLFRGVGQVSGVALSSAIFQSTLDSELRKRIKTPDAEDIITKIRHSARLVETLPPGLQRMARDSYSISLKAVFTLAMCSTLTAYLVRLPIPDISLDRKVNKGVKRTTSSRSINTTDNDNSERTPLLQDRLPEANDEVDTPFDSEDEDGDDASAAELSRDGRRETPIRRLSTYNSDGVMDLESDVVGGSARPTNRDLKNIMRRSSGI